jgi:cob(I)alamin adenosyltransferase
MSEKMSSNIRITTIRTGNGDSGGTKLGGKTFRKGHPIVQYSAALDVAQSFTYAVPKAWGDYKPRELLQELLFRLGAAVGGRTPKDQEIALQEIGILMESQIEYISGSLASLDSFIRCTEYNKDLQALRAAVREAEVRCVAARDHIELEAKEISENMLYMLEKAAKALNIASDWVFAFVWIYSTNQDGRLLTDAKWVPWDDSVFIELNK